MLNEAIINDRARAPSVIGGSLDDGNMRHEGRARPAAHLGTRSHEGPPCSPRSTTDIGAPVWRSTPNPIGYEAAVKLKSLEPGLWWSQAGSNRRPLECHSSALPAELWPHGPERAAADPGRLPRGDRVAPIEAGCLAHFLGGIKHPFSEKRSGRQQTRLAPAGGSPSAGWAGPTMPRRASILAVARPPSFLRVGRR